MTPAQKLRLRGLHASLKQRGVLLALQGTALTFDALILPVAADDGEFSLTNETRTASRIHILRESAGIGQISIGSVFDDAPASTVHRVTQIDDHPANLVVVFHCETAPAE